MSDLNLGDVLDGYEITELLARGGMATLFKAVDHASGRTVVLKIPHIQYEADVVLYERFRREEAAAQQLHHPNVVGALTPSGEKSRMYMAMEYVDGAPLSTLLDGGQPLPAPRALDIARQTCDALAYLHACGIVHRDVKPGNILLTPHGQVKVIDFGIAHIDAGRRLTIAGLSRSLGTPAYMAPEQIRGRPGDARTDVYALGTVLYQMLTGRLPFPEGDPEELLRAKRLADPTPPSVYAPGLDAALEAVVMRAIAFYPADRHATALALLEDLRDPSTAAARAPVRARRRRVTGWEPGRLAAYAAVAATLCALGSLTWLSHRRGVESAAAAAADRSVVHDARAGQAPDLTSTGGGRAR
jgi:serine/threonine protein kinase